jgi:prepilin-type N-terminal cleavage/methylation domain-containing protein
MEAWMSPSNAMSRSAEERGGFTLVEMVIALTILLVGILGVAGLMGTSVTQTRRADNLTNSALAAQQVLDRLSMLPYDSVPEGKYSDTTSFGPGQYIVVWKVEDVSETLATEGNEIKKITVLSGGGLTQSAAESYELFIFKAEAGS